MTHATPCALVDLGLVSALGNTLDETWPRLIAGDQSRFTQRDDLIPGESRFFGQVLGELSVIPAPLARYDCRNNQLALTAFEAIRGSTAAAVARFGAERVGVVVGTSTSGIAEAENAIRARRRTGHLPTSFDLVKLEFGGLAEFVAHVSGATGPRSTFATACSAGAKALVSARSLLELDVCDAVIAGAADSLCRLTANGFHALNAMSKGITNPMSRNRDGLTLGEGAALFLVTRDPGHIQLLGTGESNDAHHMSAPDPKGCGAEACIRSALDDADICASEIAYVNLHGTGTPQNDAVESAAVDRTLGRKIPCSSTKPLVGHALGASGALDIAFCWMVLQRRKGSRLMLPPHRWDEQCDPVLPPLSLVPEGAVVNTSRDSAVMSLSFGFGGSNCALVIGDAQN
jgi:3-oxoacyl-[acyl-carrier-protein] synthase-1